MSSTDNKIDKKKTFLTHLDTIYILNTPFKFSLCLCSTHSKLKISWVSGHQGPVPISTQTILPAVRLIKPSPEYPG